MCIRDSDCPSLMLGIAIRCMQHSQAMVERGVCELAHSFFHYDCLPYQGSHDANACTDVESHYFVWLAVKFPNILKTTTWLLSPCVANFSRSCVPVLITLQWSVTLRSAFYRGGKKSHFHIWGVFSFILMNIKLSRILYTCIQNIIHWVNISGFAIIDLWLNVHNVKSISICACKWMLFFRYTFPKLWATILLRNMVASFFPYVLLTYVHMQDKYIDMQHN